MISSMEPSRSPRAAASEERDATSQGRHGPDHLPPPSPRRRFPSLVLAFASSPPSQLCPTSNQPRSLRLVTFPENCFSLWFQTREGGGRCQIVSIDRSATRRDAARETRGKHDGASAEVIGFPAGYEPGRGSDRRTSSRHRGTGLHILTRPAEDAQARSCRCPHGSK